MDKTQIDMAPAFETVRTAYAAVSAMQGEPRGQQVMGIALLFRELTEALGLDPSEMLDKARRQARHAEDNYSLEIRALRAYIKEVLQNG